MQQDAIRGEEAARAAAGLVEQLGGRAIVLVGLMGAGKTSVGKRLATRLQLPFVDADAEIEKAAAATIPEIFAKHGEAYFRDGERRVIRRLLDRRPKVLATGGGAFMSAETRAAIAADGVSIWLRAELDILMARVRKRSNRPLLHTEDPEATMRRLMEERYPVYATADIHVVSRDVPHEVVAEETLTALASFLAAGSPDERPPT
ncbi:MAG TPA: shikimate kinase [Kaistia sp.]|nr:shikimate kinase [Kaistia sp.]